MKTYTCTHCGSIIYFENSVCLNCSSAVAFDPSMLTMVSLDGDGTSSNGSGISLKLCSNHAFGTCNWLTSTGDSPFCVACSLNRIIPAISPHNLERWKQIELAKHRLVYSLLRLKLPVSPRKRDSQNGIAFDFLADIAPDQRVMTGHNDGVITLNIEEADEAERVRNKLNLGEKYRTLLGHFRHEIGHYYWNVLIANSSFHNRFRKLFGDETVDYGAALERYYASGANTSWADNHISPYATAHPWEDWAETWAHYMHLMDTLETAYFFGLGVHPIHGEHVSIDVKKDPYTIADFESIFRMWLPLTFALTSLNRSMGHSDFYPFIIAPKVMEKLSFIHDVLHFISADGIPSASMHQMKE